MQTLDPSWLYVLASCLFCLTLFALFSVVSQSENIRFIFIDMSTPNILYLPNWDRDSKAYTPLGIRNLFDKAVKDQNGVKSVLANKRVNKQLIELWHSCFLALALKKWLQREFVLYPSDSPDVYFLDQEKGEGFSVEVTELYQYKENFNGDYKGLGEYIHSAKGEINLPDSHLLIVSRINYVDFNISIFCKEIQKYKWYFERIWLCLSISAERRTFFEIYPAAAFNDRSSISFDLEEDKTLWY